MNNNLKTVIKAIGFASFTFILINVIYLIVAFTNIETLENWNVLFKHGNFILNNTITGIELWSIKANTIMISVLLIVLFREYKKGKLSLIKV